MMTNKDINTKVDELRELEDKITELTKRVDAIKNELKKELDSRKVDSVSTRLHKVFYNAYEKSSVDTDKLKQEGLYDKFKKVQTVLQFRITDINYKKAIVVLNDMYGMEGRIAYYRKSGDGCFDFTSDVSHASVLNDSECKDLLRNSEFYCSQFNASSMSVI